jgi:hypothetical protein
MVGLLEDDITKNRSTGQAGSSSWKDDELNYNLERLIKIIINWVDPHE